MPANEPMIELWNGEDTAAWTAHPDRYDVMLAPFGDAVLEAAAPSPGEQVLDVGCGAGTLSLAAARAVGDTGAVAGADISRPLLALANQRVAEADVTTITFLEADVQTAPLTPATYDLIISRFGVMFFDDPIAAFRNLRNATRAGGRLVFACWRSLPENEWALVPVLAILPHLGAPDAPAPDAPGPFAFGDADRIVDILTAAGWADVHTDELRTAINVGGAGTADDAVTFYREDAFGKVLFGRGEDNARSAAVEALRTALGDHVTDKGVRLGAAAWIVTAKSD
jgi:SAM-dependent methyltransferase